MEIIKIQFEVNTTKEHIFSFRRRFQMNQPLKIGDVAPDFSLPSTKKETLTLSEYRGKKNIVVAFYGMDFTPG